MIPPMRYVLISVFALALAAWAGPAAAQSPGGDTAKFEQGKALYEARKFERAFDILRPLAEAGHAEAQYIFGRAYEHGSGPLTFDAATSLDWLLKAAKGGSIAARKRLTEVLFFSGREPASADDVWAKLMLDYYLVDGNLSRYVGLVASEDAGIQWLYDPTTVEMSRGEILRTMWFIALADTDSWYAKWQLFFRKFWQSARDWAVAEALAEVWLHGDLEAWSRAELNSRAGR